MDDEGRIIWTKGKVFLLLYLGMYLNIRVFMTHEGFDPCDDRWFGVSHHDMTRAHNGDTFEESIPIRWWISTGAYLAYLPVITADFLVTRQDIHSAGSLIEYKTKTKLPFPTHNRL